ncbi:hypothetical protein E4T56_gene20634 [Termitomyces sp. T112]|nr:hypothetical protein E4T56_gene20634 [Termitomyces sp. T112]
MESGDTSQVQPTNAIVMMPKKTTKLRGKPTQLESIAATTYNPMEGKLLGTEEGLEAMGKFLSKSGAFTKMGLPRMETTLKPALEEDEDEENDEAYWRRFEGREREGGHVGRTEEDTEERGEESKEEED